jgi:CDP-diacylglycerol---serine O-phosphatidyltransferase
MTERRRAPHDPTVEQSQLELGGDDGSLGFGSAASERRRRRVIRARRRRERARRRAYLLPSLFTIGNMLLGFYAIVLGLRDRFTPAALVIFVAAILDSLDGRIARMTGTESDFGREYDSLADLVTFGMAPALLAYLWGLQDFGRAGWLAPVFFLVCAATRLARFNVQTRKVDGRFFVGLPSPAAAGALASILFVVPSFDWKPWFNLLLMGALLALALLMVSTFRYPSFKQADLRRGWSYRVVLPIAAVVLLAAYHPPAFLVSASALYAASGPALWLRGKLRHPRPAGDAGAESTEP